MQHLATFTVLFLAAFSAHAQTIKQAKPWLGVAIAAHEKGVLINQALDGTPAKKAGLQTGDIITAINQTTVTKPEELISVVQSLGVGQSVTVFFLRGHQKKELAMQLEARPDALNLVKKKLLNKPAPALNLPVVYGKGPGTIVQGKVTVIEFWTTWCPACVASHAALSQLARDPRIHVLAISNEDSKTLQAYAKKNRAAVHHSP